MTAVYRIQQGLRALLSFSQAVDYELAGRYLNDRQMALFRQMKRSEQLHSLNVLRDVQAQESATPHDLAVAALLHDVGKIRYPLAIWQKTISVLVRRFAPRLYLRLSDGDPAHALNRPFAVNRHHPAWGAELLAQAETSERARWLVAHHADRDPTDPLLRRLQRADDRN